MVQCSFQNLRERQYVYKLYNSYSAVTVGSIKMAKFVSRILQARLSVILLYLLAIWTIPYLLFHYGTSNYPHVSRDHIEAVLYKKLNPTLVLNPSKPDCKYDLTRPSKPLHKVVIPSKFNNFLPTGIVNGSYSPPYCNPAFSVALVVPYKNRQQHLEVFLPYMHNFLRKQDIHYKIFLVEQEDDKEFNKGVLLNVGAKQAITEKFPCVIFHDIDLLPLDDNNLYTCLQQPRHLSAAVDSLRLVLPYTYLAGGAMALRTDQFTMINGYSNQFTGWGGEDDNFSERIFAQKLNILRLPGDMSRYSMLAHAKQSGNGARFSLLASNRREFAREGLNSLRVLSLHLTQHRLFTLVGVRLL